ncbi:hypothetical protein PABG_03126 [Paracoccidioides brasiliensis Pb03]|nr:hypothetical protein PABG_03126 [Paracoccidioides brasiliensis Pb03]
MSPGKHVRALVVITVFPSISLVLVALRMVSRSLSKNWGWDDVLVIIAMVMSIGMCATSWGYTKHARQGYPLEAFPSETPTLDIVGEKFNLANQLLYNPILAFVRGSIIIFILRLNGLRTHVIRSLRVLFVVNFCLMAAVFIADLFQCSPVRYIWDWQNMDREAQIDAGAAADGMKNGKVIKGGECIDRRGFFISTATLSIFLDMWLLYIPSAIVWGMNMPRRQKEIVVLVMSIGVLVTGVSIARLIVSSRRWHKPYIERQYNIDYTLSNVETNCAIWAAAAPALKSLLSRISPRWWITSTASDPKASTLRHGMGFRNSMPASATPSTMANSDECQYNPFTESDNASQGYRMDYLTPWRNRDASEEEIYRFEHDAKVSGLFRKGRNYIPEGHLPEMTMLPLSDPSIGQGSLDSTTASPNESSTRSRPSAERCQ